MTCRDDILMVVQDLTASRPNGTFTCQDVVAALRARHTTHLDATIRRLVTVEMCVNGVGPRAATYRDLEKVSRGRYRLLAEHQRRS
ncbi:hypothetical protein E7T09_04170 [Deinococcus sp. KSM4-11]|uniref:DUF7669 domain-containing protein n=1 Tax=Deinococcus sp. KSM4-11 TaxID=2568654 RepID=UPI0010A5699F|nr:hypothetical protein [Deinococcus sp. KSM4-11]THF88410.1 hypothetical protein E7T09_04170 [Deinococcus sp. KSM4-11]